MLLVNPCLREDVQKRVYRSFSKPMVAARSRKQRRHMLMLYLRIRPWRFVHTRHMREPGPKSLGCEFHSCMCPMAAFLLLGANAAKGEKKKRANTRKGKTRRSPDQTKNDKTPPLCLSLSHTLSLARAPLSRDRPALPFLFVSFSFFFSSAMGGSGSKDKTLVFGTYKATGRELHEQGIIVIEPGQLELGKSKDLVIKISSFEVGVFHIQGKFLGKEFKETAFKHQYLIELLHGSETDTTYQKLAERYQYRREGTRIGFGRGFSFDITKLLPFLYAKFEGQQLAEEGELLVQKTHFRRLDSMSKNAKIEPQPASPQHGQWEVGSMSAAIAELDQLEQGLRRNTAAASTPKNTPRKSKDAGTPSRSRKG
eukprot:m.230020 g.230020  ORF g.230020 m.230020 type:complete len:368 (-) comp22403_c8_seq1:99-1202(-)